MKFMNDVSVLYDVESAIVLYHSRSPVVVMSLVSGMHNTEIAVLPYSLPVQRAKLERFDLTTQHLRIFPRSFALELAPDHSITSEIRELKRVAALRGSYIYAWETYCSHQLARTRDVDISGLDAYVSEQLGMCDPSRGHLTDAIHEYAQALGIEPEAAYLELKLRLDSFGRIKLRNYAIFKKHLSVLNSLTSEPELSGALRAAVSDLLTGALI